MTSSGFHACAWLRCAIQACGDVHAHRGADMFRALMTAAAVILGFAVSVSVQCQILDRWFVREIYSNADGSVQFVKIEIDFGLDPRNGLVGKTLVAIHDLADYLRAALPCMRETGSTLGRELALAQAYLRILKVRMGERLDVSVEVPADLCSASLPSMMLTTLVENAIKHGLNPRPEGGTIAIRAERYGTALRIVVSDDGVGFQQKRGAGIGLANTRARLASLYGEAGLSTLEANPRGGVSATIELPYRAPGSQVTAS